MPEYTCTYIYEIYSHSVYEKKKLEIIAYLPISKDIQIMFNAMNEMK